MSIISRIRKWLLGKRKSRRGNSEDLFMGDKEYHRAVWDGEIDDKPTRHLLNNLKQIPNDDNAINPYYKRENVAEDILGDSK